MTRCRTAMVPCTSAESPCACAFCKSALAGFRDYVADFFTRSSVTRILSKDPPATQQLHPAHQTLAGPSEPKVLEIPYESLPRLLQLKYEHGLQEEHFLVKNAVEAPVPGEHVGRSKAVYHQALACRRGSILSSASAERPCSQSVVDTALPLLLSTADSSCHPTPAGGGISITCFPAFEQLVFGGYTMVNKGRLMVLFSPSLKVTISA